MDSANRKRKKPPFCADEAPSNSKRVVTTVQANDVLLGRGAIVLKNEGNIRFRQLVLANKVEYNSTGKHAVKDRVARRILKTIIADRGGKFLRKIEDSQERDHLGITTKEAWLIEGEGVCLLKVKQALREQESSSLSTPKTKPRAERAVKSRKRHDRARTATVRRNDNNDNNSTYSIKSRAVRPSTDARNESVSSSPLESDFDFVRHRRSEVVLIENNNSTQKPENVPQSNFDENLSSPRINTETCLLHDDINGQKRDKVAETSQNSGTVSLSGCNAGSGSDFEKNILVSREEPRERLAELLTRNSSDGSPESSEAVKASSSLANNLSFHLKHPSLRKRYLSRLRRQQKSDDVVDASSIVAV